MKVTTNRFALRDLTRQHHEKLDAEVGALDNRQAYERYVLGISSFRAMMEPQLRIMPFPVPFGAWRPKLIAAELAGDRADLGLGGIPRCAPFAVPQDISGLLGLLYVLEGSAFGARVLVRQAAGLGYDEHFGARHLAAQAGDTQSWPAFQAILENAMLDLDRAAHIAIETFRAACQAFEQVRYAELPG